MSPGRPSRRRSFGKKEALFRVDCLAAHDNYDWEKVASIAREWTAWNANTSDGWLLLGDALQQRADYIGAVDALLSVPEQSPKARGRLSGGQPHFVWACRSTAEGSRDL